MGKNVAVFVDVANIFYAAKAAGVDIDYILLLKAAAAGRDLVRAYAYTGLDPENENQRNFHSFLGRNGFKVVSKDIRKYGDGKVKANLDIELVVDMMKTSRNLDVAVVVSGDGDFAPAIRAVQETGVRVEVISFRGNTSSDLIDVADKFTDIVHLAKVEKGSTASGRRVATDEEDLSMTEVPDKESEGTGRGRGRGRGRARTGERVAAGRSTAGRTAERAERAAAEPVATGGATLVALPGEKLSKAAAARVAAATAEAEGAETPAEGALDAEGAEGEETRRRRRRRGGRGRGRGRGQDQAVPEGAPLLDAEPVEEEAEEEEDLLAPARPAPRPAAFGSVWDSQIGVPSAPRAVSSADEEEYDDEPAIPEYLLAERRRGQRGGQHGPQRSGQRGRGGAYAAAVERERFGGRGTSRPPEVAGRGAPPAGQRGGQRPARLAQPAPGRDRDGVPERRPASSEPWSEVPPELEELLRAQLAQKLARQEAAPVTPAAGAPAKAPARRTRTPKAATTPTAPEAAPAEEKAPAKAPARRSRTRKPAEPTETAPAAPVAEAPAKAPARRTRTPKAAATGDGA
ncbi:MAG: NYN domain-containing protein [Chloroflexi bacterium]|nr:NYN domain-containing protein [Chloroflexota bacterium]